jgi:hypothetical protein
MSGWTKVGATPNPKENKEPQPKPTTKKKNKTLSEDEICELLSTFKVRPCDDSYHHHDYRICTGYHTQNDQRRDPYKFCHDVEESRNATEKMYHPLMFRTYLCAKGGPKQCPYGQWCANAHSEAGMRGIEFAYENYEARRTKAAVTENTPVVASAATRRVDMFVPTQALSNRNFKVECQVHWRANNIRPTTAVSPLEEHEWFVLNRSKRLYHYMEEVAFREGLCTIQCYSVEDGYRMQIKGVEANYVLSLLRALLLSHPEYFLVETREFSERVMAKLKLQYKIEGQPCFSTSPDVLVQFSGEYALSVIVVGTTETSRKELIASVFDKIDFWTTQEGYNDFHECTCCFENKNEDEGALCTNGHFICSVEGCLDVAVSSQIFHIRSREEWVICPVCKAPYDIARVASQVKNTTLIDVLKAVIDKSVEKERAAMEEDFDRQLQAKTEELLENYASADETLKLKAKQVALVIRNTILNLSCPHCGIAYAEFSGCMALQCESCKAHFCAYCHFKAGSARGAHDHVRECLMNESTNGSYYADPVQIKNAQRRYRQRELKKRIRKFKKDEQNAIVIELSDNLKDLDIDPSGLFEVGSIQPPIENPLF